MDTASLSRRVKWPGRDANHPAHLAPKFKKKQKIFTSVPPLDLYGCYKAKITLWYLYANQIPPEINQRPTGDYKILFARRRQVIGWDPKVVFKESVWVGTGWAASFSFNTTWDGSVGLRAGKTLRSPRPFLFSERVSLIVIGQPCGINSGIFELNVNKPYK